MHTLGHEHVNFRHQLKYYKSAYFSEQSLFVQPFNHLEIYDL